MTFLIEKALANATSSQQIESLLAEHFALPPSGERAALAENIGDFLKKMPDSLNAVAPFMRHPVCGRAAGFAFGQLLLYCFDENDLLPESHFGEVGLIDDAYMLDRFAAMLPVVFPYVQTAAEPPGELENQRLEAVRALLRPSICDALDGAVCRILETASAMFLAPVQSGEPMERAAFGADLLDFEAALGLFSKR